MIPSKGKRAGGVKQWKTRLYCCHGNCKSNTADCDLNVNLLPFPKPCAIFLKTIVDPSVIHHEESCVQCTKANRWIHLCNRANGKLQNLSDIDKSTYICSKHFVNLSGPTESNPDPYPADQEVSLFKRRSRCKRPTRRGTSPQPEQGLQQSRLRSFAPSSAEPPLGPSRVEPVLLVLLHPLSSSPVEPSQIVKIKQEIPSQDDEDPASVPELFSVKHENPFKNLADTLFSNNFMVRFDDETIRIALGEGTDSFYCLITRTLQVKVQVYGENISEDHPVWKTIPKCFDETQYEPTIEALQKLQSEWRICKCHVTLRISTEYDLNQINPSSDHGPHYLASPGCKVLTRRGTCESCKKMLGARKRRSKQIATSNERKALRYLSRSEALACVRLARKALCLQKRKTERLRTKIAQLIPTCDDEKT